MWLNWKITVWSLHPMVRREPVDVGREPEPASVTADVFDYGVRDHQVERSSIEI